MDNKIDVEKRLLENLARFQPRKYMFARPWLHSKAVIQLLLILCFWLLLMCVWGMRPKLTNAT